MKIEFHRDKPANPTADEGLKVTYGPARRLAYRLRWYLILLLVISPVLALLVYLGRNLFFVDAPAIVTVEPVAIRAARPAVVRTMSVQIGDRVEPGQPLLQLQDNELDEDIAFLSRELDLLSVQALPQREALLINYRQALADAELALRKHEQLDEQYQSYIGEGVIPLADRVALLTGISNSIDRVHQASAQLKQAKLQFQEMSVTGPVESSRRALTQKLVQRNAQRDQLNVSAPFVGDVSDILVQQGERVAANQPLLLLSKPTQPMVVAYLDPRYIDRVTLGAQATVLLPDGKRHKAQVARPTELATKLPPQLARPFEGSPALLRVTLLFNEPIDSARWVEGMPVKVRF